MSGRGDVGSQQPTGEGCAAGAAANPRARGGLPDRPLVEETVLRSQTGGELQTAWHIRPGTRFAVLRRTLLRLLEPFVTRQNQLTADNATTLKTLSTEFEELSRRMDDLERHVMGTGNAPSRRGQEGAGEA